MSAGRKWRKLSLNIRFRFVYPTQCLAALNLRSHTIYRSTCEAAGRHIGASNRRFTPLKEDCCEMDGRYVAIKPNPDPNDDEHDQAASSSKHPRTSSTGAPSKRRKVNQACLYCRR